MRAEDLNRYAANFGEGGFRRLTDGGTVYTDCRYDFQQTTTPVALATLSTGAMPSTHGVIGARWIDYTSNRSIGLIDGDRGPGATSSSPRRSAKPCASTTPRAGRHRGRRSDVGRVMADTAAKRTGSSDALRLDHLGILRPGSPRMDRPQQRRTLQPLLHLDRVAAAPGARPLHQQPLQRRRLPRKRGRERQEEPRPERLLEPGSDYERLLYTPAGNTAVLGLAKQLIAQSKLAPTARPTC